MAGTTTTTTTPAEREATRDAQPQSHDEESGVPVFPICKSRLFSWFSWRVAGALLAFLVVLGWIFIIVMLILEEKWQLVLVAWLLLYSAAHFCYWYCKRHSLITLYPQIRLRVLTHSRNPPANGEKSQDGPPSYDEVMKTEAPPPAYFTVVSEHIKPSSGISPCVPTGIPSVSSLCSEKQPQESHQQKKTNKKRNDKRNMLTLEIRECPPAYQSPRSPRALALSPRILPSIHESGAGGSLVTATAAAAAAATATAAFSYLAPPAQEEVETMEDPIRNPIVQHLRSATMPTLEVSSNVDVSNGFTLEDVTSDVRDQIEVVDVHRSSIL